MVREPDATTQPTLQDNQLMSKHRVLSFKPQLRLEWRGQDGQNETEQPDHSASLGDSITSSTQIRFSVHTAHFPFAFSPSAADTYSRIAFSRSVGVVCRLCCSARFGNSSADRAVLFRAFRRSRDPPSFLFWLNANPTNPSATNTAPAIISQ